MFKNLKSSDWIAAGLRGLSAGATIYFGQGMGGGGDTPKDTPTPGTQTANSPIGDMDFLPDGASPILGAAGVDVPDFGATVMQNLAGGPNALAQVNTPMNFSRMKFDPTAPLFDVTPELDVDAIIPSAPPVGGLVEEVIPPNAYQVGDTISRLPNGEQGPAQGYYTPIKRYPGGWMPEGGEPGGMPPTPMRA
jgi:hypothetical protein